MKSLTIMILLTLSLNANANETVEQCYYGLYDQDTNALIIESDSKEYLESIESDYQDESMNETTLIEISYCEGV
jgi:Fe-S cluster assembly iron-binding protein IscA